MSEHPLRCAQHGVALFVRGVCFGPDINVQGMEIHTQEISLVPFHRKQYGVGVIIICVCSKGERDTCWKSWEVDYV